MPRYCEPCDTYFGDSFAVCPLCGGELPLATTLQEETWVVVGTARNPADAEILGGLLAAREIPHVVANRGVSQYPAPDAGMELYLLLVPDSFAAAVQELQAAAERGELSVTDKDLEEEA